jgi:hypothetical protein
MTLYRDKRELCQLSIYWFGALVFGAHCGNGLVMGWGLWGAGHTQMIKIYQIQI